MSNTNFKNEFYMSMLCYIIINCNINYLNFVFIPQYQSLLCFLNLYYRFLILKLIKPQTPSQITLKFVFIKLIVYLIKLYDSQVPMSFTF